MAFTPDKIHMGPARIFLGVTNPATSPTPGTDPTKIAHTNGVPADGTEIGLTDGDTVFEYNPKKLDIMVEQFYSGVAAALTEEDCTVKFTAQESTIIGLQSGMDNTGQFSDGSGFYGGAGTGAFQVRTTSVFLSARQRVNPLKYIIVLLYKAYSTTPLQATLSRTKVSKWAVTLSALADTTRTSGDNLFQLYIES